MYQDDTPLLSLWALFGECYREDFAINHSISEVLCHVEMLDFLCLVKRHKMLC